MMLRSHFGWAFGLLLILFFLLSPSVYGVEVAYHRWAIITSGTPEEMVFSDLLTAELTKVPNLELVEREQLETVTRELKLATAFSGDGCKDRLQLGRLLHADALVLTHVIDDGEGKNLQLIIAECRYGVRLFVERLPIKPEQTPALVERATAIVIETRKRFVDGIKQVIAVPSFISRSLEHDYDYLQDRYGQLVQNALMQYPGVAVIETDEARALGRELAISGGSVQRLVPLFVAGDYRVEKVPGIEPQVTIKAVVSDGTKELKSVTTGPMSLPDGARWVAVEMAPKIMAESTGAKPLSVEAQITALGLRANAFARIDSLGYSTGLREAMLLLNSNLIIQRKILVREYARMMSQPITEVPATDRQPGNPRLAAAINKRIQYYESALSHLEYLLRQRQVDSLEGLDLVQAVLATSFGVPEIAYHAGTPNYWRLGQETLAGAEELKWRFLYDVYPAAKSLPLSPDLSKRPDGPYLQIRDWAYLLLKLARERYDRTYLTRDDLGRFHRVVVELMPDYLEVPPIYTLPGDKPVFGMSTAVGPGAYTRDDYIQYLESLRDSPHHVASCLARYALLSYRYPTINEKQDTNLLQAYRAEVNALMEQFARLPYAVPSPGTPRTGEQFYISLRDSSRYVADLLNGRNVAGVPPEREVPDAGAVELEMIVMRTIPSAGAITEYNGPGRENRTTRPERLTACGNGLEVFWADGCLLFHGTPGVLESAFLAKRSPVFEDVVWDGRNVWVATRFDGIWIFTAGGTLAAKVGKDHGLPPAGEGLQSNNHAMLLHPLGAGRVLAIGSFGQDKRAWCAVVTWDKEALPVVKVFHEAIRIVKVEENPQALRHEPAMAFSPWGKFRYHTADNPPDPLLLIGRDCPRAAAGYFAPLAINLRTLQVGTFELGIKLVDSTPYQYLLGPQDEIVVTGGPEYVYVLPPPGRKFADDKAFHVIPLVNPGKPLGVNWQGIDRTQCVGAGEKKSLILNTDDRVYIPGSIGWWRFDFKTMTGQRLTRSRVTEAIDKLLFFGVSRHFGMIGWNYNEFYRIGINEKKIPAKDE